MIQNNLKNSSVDKIVGIQFSLLSPDEIRRGSVAEITSRDTYINNKPVINGLFDPRMGVLEPGFICPTDGLDNMQTPGYFGHIELAKPVFYIQYLSTILKTLKCVCFKCSKLLINKEKYSQLLSLSNEARWKQVNVLVSKVKRCGEDTNNGCGCLQAFRIKKEGLASISGEWKNNQEDEENIIVPFTPELVLKIFTRISDEDVTFMGFSPIWSRPDWMICQVLAVPPPAVRPSVKHDAQQRSEDDLSHILVNIIKTNKTLLEKIQNNSPGNVINDWLMVLQYYIGSMVDNKIPGANPVAQRSGRPLKSIKDRLNGKGGRMRGNLMAKRVDFSARSVITADPNISIGQLGIPLKIAKNITKPVVVNDLNKQFLTKLVQNGPEIYPGAKILDRKTGQSITLRYIDRKTLELNNGDVVHRHMMDGDVILFNRQPTLHRMSMMCHIAKVMKRGDTFRMNVADTKPYNADFDGDEMNLHMPQDVESESELKNLAAVKYQIISPANNASIIGIYQDSMLGSFQFTKSKTEYSKFQAMNLLMMFNHVNTDQIKQGKTSNFDIISQILPPLSLKSKNKLFDDSEDKKTSNNIIEIINGEYIRGQIDKGILGSGSNGLIHRICNDFGNQASSDFIDDWQNIITEYLKSESFSVGISDLIADKTTNESIINVITNKKKDVNSLIDEIKLGIFENNSGRTNEQEFETKVNNILNQAAAEAGKIGLNSLSSDNRFVTMVKAGSKGSELNISQMISCLGQQNVDSKRIPYGFDDRTLPHFSKYDDSPVARGFVESSYINGLSPQELFFHAMGGRVGLIDTAVKTSTTGYIQRRLIKGMEDLVTHYDMTIRNNKNKIVQFKYGDDNFDTIKVENQDLPFINHTSEEIYSHYLFTDISSAKNKVVNNIFTKPIVKKINSQKDSYMNKAKIYIDLTIKGRKDIIKNVFKNKDEKRVHLPVAFQFIIENLIGQEHINSSSVVDISPLDAFEIIERGYSDLEQIYYAPPNELFKVLYFYFLSPKHLLFVKRINARALNLLIETIKLNYKRALINPGEMVGMIAAQSIGEPTTQLTLNTFHYAGVASKSNVTRGVPRIEEILSLTSELKNPSLTIYLKPDDQNDKDKATSIMYTLEHTKLDEIVKKSEICFDPDDFNTLIDKDDCFIKQYKEYEQLIESCIGNTNSSNITSSKWIIRLEFDPEVMLEKNITMNDIDFSLNSVYGEEINCVYSDFNDDKLIFRIRLNNINKNQVKKNAISSLDQSDQIFLLKNFQDQLLNNIVIRGIKKINKVVLRKIKNTLIEDNSSFKRTEYWVLDTIGSNLLEVLSLDCIDQTRTISNDIMEVYNVLGIEAAREVIYNELADVIEFDGTYLNFHHMGLLCDRMTYNAKLISIFRHGINNDNIGPIAKASFEETPEMFLRAARHSELDSMTGVSANIMCGQEGFVGTNVCQVILNLKEALSMNKNKEIIIHNELDEIEKELSETKEVQDECDISNLKITSSLSNIKKEKLGDIDEDYDPFQ